MTVFPSGETVTSRGKPWVATLRVKAGFPWGLLASMTLRVDGDSGATNRLEFATTIRLPSSATVTPTGAGPTRIHASRGFAAPALRRLVSNSSTALLPRAVTHVRPVGLTATRTGPHPTRTVSRTVQFFVSMTCNTPGWSVPDGALLEVRSDV